MPTNRNAQLRYQVLDRCFSNRGRNFYWQDLLHEINLALEEYNGQGSQIKRRQLFEDIKFMESDQGWSIPLDRLKNGRKVYYRYSDPEFSISNQPLNEDEKGQINAAITVLSRFAGAPQFEWVQELIPVLQDRLGLKLDSREVISLDANIDLKGIEFLSPLFNAITEKLVLKVEYKSFKSDESFDFTFHPHFLKQYNNRWFAFGLNEEHEIPTMNLALDRIISIEHVQVKYNETEIEWQEYFDDIIGVSKFDQVEESKIVLEVTSEQAPYILTKPLHGSQKNYWKDEKLIVEINVIPNYELESLILSFGEKVRVIEPIWLLDKIKDRIESVRKNYE